MAGQSLFKACKIIDLMRASGNADVGGYSIDFELYRQKDVDANVEAISRGEATRCTFGDADESKVVLLCDTEITIPAGFKLTPVSPKKSMVVMCNTLVNNGEISMTGKGPNVLPHDWFLLGFDDTHGDIDDIVIPAYANNGVSWNYTGVANGNNGVNGVNGTDRQCGSGGGPGNNGGYNGYDPGAGVKEKGKTGSGYAFGGGAGCGGTNGGLFSSTPDFSVNSTYPMRGSSSSRNCSYPEGGPGGVGNPPGTNLYGGVNTSNVSLEYTAPQNTGVGGRVVIFCNTFINNGTVSANGINASSAFRKKGDNRVHVNGGGASGGGAIDLFYDVLDTEGTITVTGGQGVKSLTCGYNTQRKSGNGGNGSVTLLQWRMKNIVKAPQKAFSRANMIYFLQGLADGIRGIRGI